MHKQKYKREYPGYNRIVSPKAQKPALAKSRYRSFLCTYMVNYFIELKAAAYHDKKAVIFMAKKAPTEKKKQPLLEPPFYEYQYSTLFGEKIVKTVCKM